MNFCHRLPELLVCSQGQNKELTETRREIVQEWRFAPLIGEVMIHDYVQTRSWLLADAKGRRRCWAFHNLLSACCSADWLNLNPCWFEELAPGWSLLGELSASARGCGFEPRQLRFLRLFTANQQRAVSYFTHACITGGISAGDFRTAGNLKLKWGEARMWNNERSSGEWGNTQQKLIKNNSILVGTDSFSAEVFFFQNYSQEALLMIRHIPQFSHHSPPPLFIHLYFLISCELTQNSTSICRLFLLYAHVCSID